MADKIMTNLQELREIIIKANPPNEDYDDAISSMYPEHAWISINKDGSLETYCEEDEDFYPVDKKDLPLAMVLNAVALKTNRNPFETTNDSINLTIKGIFINWDLAKDLDHQDPQMILNLLTLLKQK